MERVGLALVQVRNHSLSCFLELASVRHRSGGLQCAASTGEPPATLAEWTLAATGQDNYDVSIVDGFSLPMAITTTVGCPEPSCPTDFDATGCPDKSLQVIDSSGKVVGCKSACLATVQNNTAGTDSAICCTGTHNTLSTCPASGIPYYSEFKAGCPTAYVYAYDDKAALVTCPSTSAANYGLVFCPSSSCGATSLPSDYLTGLPTSTKTAGPSSSGTPANPLDSVKLSLTRYFPFIMLATFHLQWTIS